LPTLRFTAQLNQTLSPELRWAVVVISLSLR
jgi:hypothetical protein